MSDNKIRVMSQQLSLFGLRPTVSMEKSPSEVTIEIDEISRPTKEFIYYDK